MFQLVKYLTRKSHVHGKIMTVEEGSINESIRDKKQFGKDFVCTGR